MARTQGSRVLDCNRLFVQCARVQVQECRLPLISGSNPWCGATCQRIVVGEIEASRAAYWDSQ